MGVCSVPRVPDWNNSVLGELRNGLSGNRETINKIQLEFIEASRIKPSHFHWGCLEQTGSIILAASV